MTRLLSVCIISRNRPSHDQISWPGLSCMPWTKTPHVHWGVTLGLQALAPTVRHDDGISVQELPAQQIWPCPPHAVHVPDSHTPLLPHAVPSATLEPVSSQTGEPVEQSVAPVSHGLPGVHAAPSVHATQLPLSQTSFDPQLTPFETALHPLVSGSGWQLAHALSGSAVPEAYTVPSMKHPETQVAPLQTSPVAQLVPSA